MCRNCEPILGSQKVKVFWSRAYIKHGLDQTYVFHFAVLLLLKLIPDPALVPGGWMWIQLWYGKTETPWSLQSAFLQCVLHVASPPSYSLSSVKGLWSCLQIQRLGVDQNALVLTFAPYVYRSCCLCEVVFYYRFGHRCTTLFCIATDLLIPDPALVPGGGMQISRNKPPSANGFLLPLAVARIASTARCDKPM